jgi:hypothetical protein
MDKFACDFILTKCDEVLEYEDETLISSIARLYSYIDFYAELFESFKQDKEKEIKELPNGEYDVFGYGEVWCETSRDWESGLIDNAEWIFDFEFVSINKNTWMKEQREEDERLKGTDISRAELVVFKENEEDKEDW